MLRRSFMGLLALLPFVRKAKPRRTVTLTDAGAGPFVTREYGRLLAGDGVADDTEAMRQEIESWKGITFPGGTYWIR